MKTKTIIGLITVLMLLGILSTTANAGDEGFIYGKVLTRSGETYIGALRWGKQEAFWDDIFNATKDDNPYLKYVERDRDRYDRDVDIKIFGMKINTQYAGTHLFITRFGDIASIKVKHRGDTIIKMKTGSEYYVTGSGDVGESILILDDSLGKIKLKWDSIKSIDFMETPAKIKREGYRLKGKVLTNEMEFKGYIMWDAEECISTDILDGDSEDGDMEIEFGNIRSLTREGRHATMVTLKDGREFSLRGSNDVNDSNRGIYVYDDRFGKIEVNWSEFRKIEYEDDNNDSGPGYNKYKPKGKLEGTVETIDGDKYVGKIVFDLDESEGFEILNGNFDDMEFYIPFENIVSIKPRGRHSSIVKFRSGESLRLEDAQDVSDSNDGILIFPEKGGPDYVPWEDVELVTFK